MFSHITITQTVELTDKITKNKKEENLENVRQVTNR